MQNFFSGLFVNTTRTASDCVGNALSQCYGCGSECFATCREQCSENCYESSGTGICSGCDGTCGACDNSCSAFCSSALIFSK